jgi:hypothetical protein
MMENVEREVVRGNDTPKYRRYEEDDLSWLKTEGGLAQCASALNGCASASKESTTTLFRQLGRDAE